MLFQTKLQFMQYSTLNVQFIKENLKGYLGRVLNYLLIIVGVICRPCRHVTFFISKIAIVPYIEIVSSICKTTSSTIFMTYIKSQQITSHPIKLDFVLIINF